MGLVKFNKTATEYEARNNYEQDVIYFPTDGDAIYLNGVMIAGMYVTYATGATAAYYVRNYFDFPTDANYSAKNGPFRYVFHDTNVKNLPPSRLIESAAEYQDIDIVLQSFENSGPVKSEKQICELIWPNGTNSSNADIQPTYEKWERLWVGNTFYEWRKVQSSNKGELEIDVYIKADGEGFTNIAEVAECGTDWIYEISSDKQRKIFDFVKNGGTDITFNIRCGSFNGEARKKASYVAYYSDSNDGMEHVVVGIQTKGMNDVNFYMHKLDITGFA